MTVDDVAIKGPENVRANSREDGGLWRSDSLCRRHPTQWWFAGGAHETVLAKGICAGCTVQEPCLEFALGRPELLGVWASTTPSERAAIRRARRPVDTESPVDIDLCGDSGDPSSSSAARTVDDAVELAVGEPSRPAVAPVAQDRGGDDPDPRPAPGRYRSGARQAVHGPRRTLRAGRVADPGRGGAQARCHPEHGHPLVARREDLGDSDDGRPPPVPAGGDRAVARPGRLRDAAGTRPGRRTVTAAPATPAARRVSPTWKPGAAPPAPRRAAEPSAESRGRRPHSRSRCPRTRGRSAGSRSGIPNRPTGRRRRSCPT